jgi:Alkaline phosphatase PhoX
MHHGTFHTGIFVGPAVRRSSARPLPDGRPAVEEDAIVEVPRSRPGRRMRMATLLAGLALAATIPGSVAAHGHGHGYTTSSDPWVALEGGVSGSVKALINSGEVAFGTTFEGLPDGIGVVPGSRRSGYVDLYVTHEQSPVPFGGFSDFQNSSVSKVRVDIKSKSIKDLDVALSPDLGFARFCSAFMVGPAQGFSHYTFLVNEETNDIRPVPAGAPYGPDPATAPYRQAGYTAYLDTRTGKVDVLAGAGRMNHENLVVVPGWKKGTYALTGDDTFTFPSTPQRPNLSQLYMYGAKNASHFLKDDGHLWAFRVTATDSGKVNPSDPHNGANDFFDINVGQKFKGEFIRVPDSVADGRTGANPQDALEDWSNAHNVFQFIRVEDIAYDPDHPRVVYFADTGNSRLLEDSGTGRLWRAPSGTPGTLASDGRVYKMVLNAKNPKKVDSFSILVDASSIGMVSPDNVAVSHRSIMVQEDTANAKIWQYSLHDKTWKHVASATQPTAETSGIVDVSRWFGAGWWALDVQSHTNQSETTGTPFVWDGPPGPAVGTEYQMRRENGQLLLMKIKGS